MHKNVILFIFISILSVGLYGSRLYAQQAIIELETDDTLPIASTRFDDAVEPPKDNFSSVNKNDSWERFERGELDQKAFIKLQEEYQAQVSHSKDPYVQKKHKQRQIASERRAKRAARIKAKREAKKGVKHQKKSSKKMVSSKGKTSKRVPASTKNRAKHVKKPSKSLKKK